MYGNLDPIEHEHRTESVVIVLVGLIGAGKSTFAEALQEYVPQIRRCNQDELGNRRNVEEASRSSLREGLSVCIDRTNLDSTQRSHWIGIAREFPGTPVWVIVFDTPYDVCAARLSNRRNHPTITDANHGMQVLSRFASSMEPPHPAEGYDKLITLNLEQQPPSGYTKQDVLAILQRLRDAPHACVSTPTEPRAQHDLIGTRVDAAAGIHAGEAAVAAITGLGEIFPRDIGASIKMGTGLVKFRSSLGDLNDMG